MTESPVHSPAHAWILAMQRILRFGRTVVAALFAVSLMLIVMLIAAVMAVPALAAGTPAETREAAARAKPAAAARNEERAESPVQAEVTVAPVAVEAQQATEAPQAPEAQALPAYPKHLIVLKVVNLLSPPQLDEILRQVKGEGRIMQDAEHHLVILRGDNSFMVSSMDLLKRSVHLRKDVWPDKSDTADTLVEVYRFMRLDPKEGIALIKRTLPKNEARIELRESSRAVVVEGPFKAVNEVMDLLQQSDGLRPHFMVRKAFDVKIEPVNRASGDQRVDDERERE